MIVALIGIVSGVMLTLAAKFMAVPEDGVFSGVRELLPGVNCGACGCSGCDVYARRIVETNAPLNLCTPGGNQTACALGEFLGREAGTVVEMQAIVRCSGSCTKTDYIMDYQDLRTCESNNYFYQGRGSCSHACLGFGDCVSACQYGAIHINDGVAVVDPWICTGCGMCVEHCPNALITTILRTSKVFVGCYSHDAGAFVRRLCKIGCTGCRLCERKCPSGAIVITRNLASVDPEKCTNCGECVAVCPSKCIHTTGVLTKDSVQ